MRIYLIRTTGSAFIHHCLYLSFDKKRLSNSSYLLACLSKPFAIRFMLFLCFVFRCLRASGLNIFIYQNPSDGDWVCFFFPLGEVSRNNVFKSFKTVHDFEGSKDVCYSWICLSFFFYFVPW